MISLSLYHSSYFSHLILIVLCIVLYVPFNKLFLVIWNYLSISSCSEHVVCLRKKRYLHQIKWVKVWKVGFLCLCFATCIVYIFIYIYISWCRGIKSENSSWAADLLSAISSFSLSLSLSHSLVSETSRQFIEDLQASLVGSLLFFSEQCQRDCPCDYLSITYTKSQTWSKFGCSFLSSPLLSLSLLRDHNMVLMTHYKIQCTVLLSKLLLKLDVAMIPCWQSVDLVLAL